MPPAAEDICQPPWHLAEITALIGDLESLRKAMLEREAGLAPWIDAVAPARRASAANLAHYLALRQIDLRPIQDRLAGAGLSSLGRAETHVLANVDKVLGVLHRIAGLPWRSHARDEPNGFHVVAPRCWRVTRGPCSGQRLRNATFGSWSLCPARRHSTSLWSPRWCRAEWTSRGSTVLTMTPLAGPKWPTRSEWLRISPVERFGS
jgi:hypothetical protein